MTSSYLRPPIDTPVIRDADGRVISYGDRWDGDPPEDSYSVDTHPERFAPIHVVADALIAHLSATYDVEVIEELDAAAEFRLAPSDVVRAVRIRPNDPTCAALSFAFTTYPGVHMRAGLLHDFRFPSCGCDACDSNWEAEAELLERQAFAVATGHYRETVERGFRPWCAHMFTYPDGSSGGRGRMSHLPGGRVRAATSILRRLPDGWAAWPEASAPRS